MSVQFGMVGMGTMGANLVRNMLSHGYSVAVTDVNAELIEQFTAECGSAAVVGVRDIAALLAELESPRRVFVLVPAGNPVESVIGELLSHMSVDDVILECGNSHFADTQQRQALCAEHGVHLLGVGISGGAEGALKGPSLMPGGSAHAWESVKCVLESLAAVADGPCVDYIGTGGSGHYVKMVHNGIEYAVMQLIAEAYHILSACGGFEPRELANVFAEWNSGRLESFLVEITAKIFERKDDLAEGFLVDKILDTAAQKGTGKWTAQESYNVGVAVPCISAAVEARIVSALKESRIAAASQRTECSSACDSNACCSDSKDALIAEVESALYGAVLVSYAQGMALLSAASAEYDWQLKLGTVARVWRGGCIIRAGLLADIQRSYSKKPDLANLMDDTEFSARLWQSVPAWRKMVTRAVNCGIPVLCFGSGLSYLDAYHTARLPQNLVQAQRDFFGAHTYRRVDREGVFHTEW